MAYHPKFRTQDCPECGTQLLSVSTSMVEIGSPLVVCPGCGKTSYTRLRREWYNYPDKDLTFIIPLATLAFGIGIIACMEYSPLDIALGGIVIAIAIGCAVSEAKKVAESRKRMRDPVYLAELLQWGVLRQGEYEDFIRDAEQKEG